MDIVRLLRIIEYVGERAAVEEQVRNSIHGTRVVNKDTKEEVSITAVTVNEFPLPVAQSKASNFD